MSLTIALGGDARCWLKEFARLKARGALVEWRTYHLDQFVEQFSRWMPEDAWDACSGDPVFDPRLRTYVCVRVAHDNRSAAVAIAQQQGDRIMLRVRTFPEHRPAQDEYVDAASIEEHIEGLHKLYPAHVVAEIVYHVGGQIHRLPRHGPEVLHHGAFFEPSR